MREGQRGPWTVVSGSSDKRSLRPGLSSAHIGPQRTQTYQDKPLMRSSNQAQAYVSSAIEGFLAFYQPRVLSPLDTAKYPLSCCTVAAHKVRLA